MFIEKARKEKNTAAITVHISIEIIRKLRCLLNHIELSTSQTIIETGAAYTKASQLSLTFPIVISVITKIIVAISHTNKIEIPVIKPRL